MSRNTLQTCISLYHSNFENMNRYLFLALLSIILMSCGSRSTADKAEAGEAQRVKNTEQAASDLTVNTALSKIHWKGFKPGGGHHGTLSLKEGTVNLKNGALVGGRFVIDMNTIVDEDLTGESNQKLVGHLKSADFFDVAQYPVSEFVITSLLPGGNEPTQEITGNLTMKGVTKSIGFVAEISVNNGKFMASTSAFTVDRTQWGVNYGSKNIFKNLADSFINDEMEIQIQIVGE